jgi:hypothetical protein
VGAGAFSRAQPAEKKNTGPIKNISYWLTQPAEKKNTGPIKNISYWLGVTFITKIKKSTHRT